MKINDSTTVKKIEEVKHYKTVHATVTTVQQSFSVTAYGKLSVFEPGSEVVHWASELSDRAHWSHEYHYCTGDERALPACTCGFTGRYASPPDQRRLLDRAVSGLPRAARRKLIQRYAAP